MAPLPLLVPWCSKETVFHSPFSIKGCIFLQRNNMKYMIFVLKSSFVALFVRNPWCEAKIWQEREVPGVWGPWSVRLLLSPFNLLSIPVHIPLPTIFTSCSHQSSVHTSCKHPSPITTPISFLCTSKYPYISALFSPLEIPYIFLDLESHSLPEI